MFKVISTRLVPFCFQYDFLIPNFSFAVEVASSGRLPKKKDGRRPKNIFTCECLRSKSRSSSGEPPQKRHLGMLRTCVCVCVRARARVRERGRDVCVRVARVCVYLCVCVCVHVWCVVCVSPTKTSSRERERECVCVCVCACLCPCL